MNAAKGGVAVVWAACILSLAGDLSGAWGPRTVAAALLALVLVARPVAWLGRASGRLAVLVAVAAVLLAFLHGDPLALGGGAGRNLSVVVLLLCVSLLRLPVKVSGLDQELVALLRGIRSRTRMAAVTLLSTALAPVLNLGTVAFLGAILKGRSSPETNVPRAVTRGVGTAMLWSPTFAPVALVMAAFPQVPWLSTLPIALPLLALALGLALWSSKGEVAVGEAAPAADPARLVPVGVLLAIVAAAMVLFRGVAGFPVTASVSLAGLAGFVAWFCCLDPRPFRQVADTAVEHTAGAFGQMAAEIALFLASGLLAEALRDSYWVAGLQELLHFIHQPTWQAMAAIVWGVPLLAILGIHPIVPFSVLVHSVTAASLGVQPPVLYMMWVVVWMLSLIVSPASALNMTASASFGLSSWQLGSGSNWLFGAAFGVAAVFVLHNYG